MSGMADTIESNVPCPICGSHFYERDDEGTDRCIECESPLDTDEDFDWRIYVMHGGRGHLADVRLSDRRLAGLVPAIRRFSRHGDIEVKVTKRGTAEEAAPARGDEEE